ncbi:transcription elongation GreA/GreB family factor [Variovorax boronicumulans]|uniref:transglycosylase SLT domain-containing protein n=1 Tax=Variovorax boronicumulans TaxID=436515 RepID=UPI00277D7428|nr:transglycosylase SLT domain-containing protein [Variovorax boronicumulans]MDQ0035844.1 transcription elongation GreA/GreB family factor [Variovorax boronicumulans]
MIDGMFQTGTDQALDDQIQRPAPFKPNEPGFSLFGLGRGAVKGVGGGVANTLAFGAEITGAFGDVAGAGGFNQGGMFSTPTAQEKLEQDAAAKRLREQGPEFSNEAGDMFRQRNKEIMPDPTASHASEQVVAGLTQFVTQAVGYAATTGPAAPFLLGGDVGMAEADKLKQQGVDRGTRTAAGAVAGVVAGVSIALPVAIPGSVAKTAALVAVGGPGGFIAQNAATQAILNNAGYDKIGSTYDPLDPTGLLLSTLVPAGFGAVAVRGARAKAAPTLKEVVLGLESGGKDLDAKGNVLTSPKGAKGRMQVMDATNQDPGYGVRPAADNSLAERERVGSELLDAWLKKYGSEDKAMAAYNAGPGALEKALARSAKEGGDYLRFLPAETQAYVTKGMKRLGEERTNVGAREAIARDPDLVAAARVRQTLNAIDSYRLTSDSDLAGMTRHQDAMEAAHDQMARGEPVSVSDLLALDSVRAGRLLDDQIAAGESQRAALLGDAGNVADPGQVRQIRAELDQLKAQRPDDSAASIKARAKELQESDQLSYKQAQTAARKEFASALETHDAQLARLNGLLDDNARAQRATEEVGRVDTELAVLREQRAALDVPATSPRSLALALNEAFRPLPTPRVRTAVEAPPRATGRQMLAAAGETAPPAPAARAPAAGEPASAGKADDTAALDRQAAEVADLQPDLMVQMEGMDKPVRAADLLEQVKKEAADETRDASLVDVAANCFLRSS